MTVAPEKSAAGQRPAEDLVTVTIDGIEIAVEKGTLADLDTLLDVSDNILGRSFCALGDGATSCIASSLKYFRDDYVALLPPEEQARLGRSLRIEPVKVAS